MKITSWMRKEEQLEPVVKDPVTPVDPPVEKPGTTKYFDKNGKLLINAKVLALTKHFEGFEPIARDDGYGTPTIGYGRIKYPDGTKVKNGDKCSEADASSWLLYDLFDEGAKYVRAFLKDDIENALSEDEFSVWVDLTFNRGAGRFRDYITPYLNKGDTAGALKSLVTINTAAGQYSLGLDRRRWAERAILEGKDWTPFQDIKWFREFRSRGYK